MSKVQVGKKVPDFRALLDNEETFKFSENKGKNLVIYFYPKDNTPGCTKEGEDFRDNYNVLKKLNTEVIGVSKDSAASHQKFIAKFNFPFNLISDEDEKICKRNFGASNVRRFKIETSCQCCKIAIDMYERGDAEAPVRPF